MLVRSDGCNRAVGLPPACSWALSTSVAVAQQQDFDNPNSGGPNRNQGNFNQDGNSNSNNQQHPADVPMTHYTGREHGSLGVSLADNGRGDVWVRTVVPTSPADRAGLRPGDQILAFDNQPIHSYRDAVHAINLKGPYDQLVAHVRRNGQDGTLTAALMPHQAPGDNGNPTAMQGPAPGYFQHPQAGTTHMHVLPPPGYAGAQPTFSNAPQTGYNNQQGGNNSRGLPPLNVVGPPMRYDLGNNAGIQPTGPAF